MPGAFGSAPVDRLLEAARAAGGTDGQDFVREVTCQAPYRRAGNAARRVVAYDFGIKTSIIEQLATIADDIPQCQDNSLIS